MNATKKLNAEAVLHACQLDNSECDPIAFAAEAAFSAAATSGASPISAMQDAMKALPVSVRSDFERGLAAGMAIILACCQ
jgi:hypothetical protein